MRERPGAVAAFFVLCFAWPASAVPAVSSPAAGEFVRTGQLVEVRWDGIPAGTEEMELLLSLDDGATFPVRLTEKLDGGRRSAFWRVPNLPATRARLLIRYESDGVETAGAKGPAFRIVGDSAMPLEAPRRRDGELWLDASPREAPDVGSFEDTSEPTLRDAAGEEALLETSRGHVARPDAIRGISENLSPVTPSRTAPASCRLDLPGIIPQRK